MRVCCRQLCLLYTRTRARYDMPTPKRDAKFIKSECDVNSRARSSFNIVSYGTFMCAHTAIDPKRIAQLTYTRSNDIEPVQVNVSVAEIFSNWTVHVRTQNRRNVRIDRSAYCCRCLTMTWYESVPHRSRNSQRCVWKQITRCERFVHKPKYGLTRSSFSARKNLSPKLHRTGPLFVIRV